MMRAAGGRAPCGGAARAAPTARFDPLRRGTLGAAARARRRRRPAAAEADLPFDVNAA
jgi:hypothetical protein